MRSPLADIGGQITDFGDLIHVEAWLTKGNRRRFVWHVSAPRDTSPADRISTTPVLPHYPGADFSMDLQADKQVTLSPKWEDEMGNATTAPADATFTVTVDDSSVIALTDNGDGSANVASTGLLGTATVHGEATFGGRTATGDMLVVVVAGDAERFEFEASEPTEVTPDA